MKNLFFTGLLLMFFGSAIAQDTPKTTKQSTGTTDTIKKKSKSGTNKSATTYKTDTVKHSTHKKTTTTTKSTNSVSGQGRDSIPGSTKP